MPNSQAPADWSKDFVEHLRAVHFALITISAGLILLIFSSKQYNAATALVQMEEILDLKKQWSIDWIAKHGNRFPDFVVPENEYASSLTPKFNAEVLMIAQPQLFQPFSGDSFVALFEGLTFQCRPPKENWFHDTPTSSSWSLSQFPRTLNDFKLWWENLDQTPPIYLPKSVLRRWFIGPDFHSKVKKRQTPFVVPVNLNLGLQASPDGVPNGFYSGKFEINGHPQLLVIYITSFWKYGLTQSSVYSAFRNLKSGRFENSFRDLSTATHDEADLPLETIKDFLHDEASKGSEVFEAFGMKFPAGQITFGGVVLVLSVQLYFFVYLRQVFGKLKPDDPGWNVPWIGMDSSNLSKMIVYVSFVILPCITAILLGWQATVRLSSGYWEKTEHWLHPVHFLTWPWHWHYTVIVKIFGLILAAIASGYLGHLSWKYRPQVAREAPSCSRQLFE